MIDRLDHLVLTTAHEEACIAFYAGVPGMEFETFGEGRKAFRFGDQKGNQLSSRGSFPILRRSSLRSALET